MANDRTLLKVEHTISAFSGTPDADALQTSSIRHDELAEAYKELASEVYGLPSGPSGQVIGLSLSP